MVLNGTRNEWLNEVINSLIYSHVGMALRSPKTSETVYGNLTNTDLDLVTRIFRNADMFSAFDATDSPYLVKNSTNPNATRIVLLGFVFPVGVLSIYYFL